MKKPCIFVVVVVDDDMFVVIAVCFLFQDMVNVIDQDGDGDISFNEFVWLMTRLVNHYTRRQILTFSHSHKMTSVRTM